MDNVSKEAFEEKRSEYHKELEEDFFGSYRVETVETYKIKRGDNIWTLCTEVFELPLWVLIKYNPFIDFNSLKPSQKLIVPVVEATGENGASPLDDPLPGSTS